MARRRKPRDDGRNGRPVPKCRQHKRAGGGGPCARRHPRDRDVAPCGRVVFCCCLGVFALLFEAVLPLRCWGRPSPGSVAVRFVFRWGRDCRAVVCWCSSRSEAARLLWRFRAALRWARSLWRACWGGILRPPARVVGLEVPRFGLRWLALRPVRVSVGGWRVCVRRFPPGRRWAAD